MAAVPEGPLNGPAPLLTVVTAVFNGARTLQATIDSLRKQTFRNFEYLVLDGQSTDETVRILERNSAQITFWSSEPDSGIYNAWNKALDRARGQWIAFLGADDVYAPDALARYAESIAENSSSDIEYISSRVRLVKDARVLRTIGLPWSWPAFSRYMTVAHVGSVHHRSLFERYGPFDEGYRSCADYELLLRPRDKLRTVFIDHVTADMTLGGISNSNLRASLTEQERAKQVTGGRPGWLCSLERRLAMVSGTCRALLRS